MGEIYSANQEELEKNPQKSQEEVEAGLNRAQEMTEKYEQGKKNKDLNEYANRIVEAVKNPEPAEQEPSETEATELITQEAEETIQSVFEQEKPTPKAEDAPENTAVEVKDEAEKTKIEKKAKKPKVKKEKETVENVSEPSPEVLTEEQIQQEVEEKLIEKYEKGAELSQETKNTINETLALEAASNRGLDLKKDLEKEQIPLETHYLLIRNLNKEIKTLEQKGGEEKRVELIKKAQKELVEKITGESLDLKATEELKDKYPGILLSKEEYVKSIVDASADNWIKLYAEERERMNGKYDEIIQTSKLSEQQQKKLSEKGSIKLSSWPKNVELGKEEITVAISMGIDAEKIKRKGLFSKKIMAGEKVIADNIEDFRRQLAVGRKDLIKNTVTAEITKKAEKNYDIGRAEYETAKKEIIQREIDSFVASSQMAEGGVGGVYEKIKTRLVSELLQEFQKRERSPEETNNFEKTFKNPEGEKAPGLDGFIKEGLQKRESLTGKPSDAKILSEFLKGYGVSAALTGLKNVIKSPEYKTALGKKKGFIDFLLILASRVIENVGKKSKTKKIAK
jgi:hypothetical protein